MKNDVLAEYLTELRKKLENTWTEATASPKLRPIAGKPISTGQCSATSIVLLDLLSPHLEPEVTMRFAVGSVYDLHTQAALIPLHVWILLYRNPDSEPMVIDITADQAPEISDKVILALPSELMRRNLLYQPHNISDVLKPQTCERAVLLRSLMHKKSYQN